MKLIIILFILYTIPTFSTVSMKKKNKVYYNTSYRNTNTVRTITKTRDNPNHIRKINYLYREKARLLNENKNLRNQLNWYKKNYNRYKNYQEKYNQIKRKYSKNIQYDLKKKQTTKKEAINNLKRELNSDESEVKEKIYINNYKRTNFPIQSKFKIERSGNIYKIKKGTIILKKDYIKNVSFIYGIKLCISGLNEKRRWHTKECSNLIKIDKNIFKDKNITITNKSFKLSRIKNKDEWYTLSTMIGKKGKGYCYAHRHR